MSEKRVVIDKKALSEASSKHGFASASMSPSARNGRAEITLAGLRSVPEGEPAMNCCEAAKQVAAELGLDVFSVGAFPTVSEGLTAVLTVNANGGAVQAGSDRPTQDGK